MNKWLRRVLSVLRPPVLLGLFVFGLIGWVLIVMAEKKSESPRLMVTGHSSCAIAMQKRKERSEKQKGTL